MVPLQSRCFPCNIIIHICTALIQGERNLQCLKAFGENIFFNLKYVWEKKRSWITLRLYTQKWQNCTAKTPLTKSQDALSWPRSSSRCPGCVSPAVCTLRGGGIYSPLEGPGFLPSCDEGRPWSAPSCWYNPSRSIWFIGAARPFCMANWLSSIPCLARAICCSWTFRLAITFCTYIISWRGDRDWMLFFYIASESQAISRFLIPLFKRKWCFFLNWTMTMLHVHKQTTRSSTFFDNIWDIDQSV